MHTKHTALLALALVAAFASCKKDDDDEVPTPEPTVSSAGAIADYALLEDGNYWVHERIEVDSVGNDQGTPHRIDSMLVSGDTVVDGFSFKKIRRWSNGVQMSGFIYWRMSGDSLIDRLRGLIFCTRPFGVVLHTDSNNVYMMHWWVEPDQVPIVVPAGSFSAYRFGSDFINLMVPPLNAPEWKWPRSYWTAGVGRVQQFEFYSSSPIGFRYDLLRYHVQ